MSPKYLSALLLLVPTALIGWKVADPYWILESHNGYNLYYTASDKVAKTEYVHMVDNGVNTVKNFFNSPFAGEFNIFLHPDRKSLDSTWQKDWSMPDFKSECWMVASGVAAKLDIISPQVWSQQACEHTFSDKQQTQQLIAHELFHVFHGQQNISPDFSNTEGIDWFVEGLATYASGQCDSAKMAAVKNAVLKNETPSALDNFWTGKLRYGLSGSIVMYIDKTYGRNELKSLLPLNKKSEILGSLNITEARLVAQWKEYMIARK